MVRRAALAVEAAPLTRRPLASAGQQQRGKDLRAVTDLPVHGLLAAAAALVAQERLARAAMPVTSVEMAGLAYQILFLEQRSPMQAAAAARCGIRVSLAQVALEAEAADQLRHKATELQARSIPAAEVEVQRLDLWEGQEDPAL
jgi:hypothetical protein